ncbi:MAG TPA: hypothetical protein VMN58_04555 [Acidimicrobiales bacterium]|nr:hypothetical protein [Acidimicrobiales bacterium]
MTGAAAAEEAMAAADEAFGRSDLEAVVAHLSAAVRGFTTAGSPRQAAMACVNLGEVYGSFMGNLTAARAWFVRARRLIGDEPDCVEQGWVAVAALGCDVADPDELLAGAELALDRARRFGDVNLETKALADGGLAHVQAGRVAEGMALLDEAMALACGPADNRDATGKSVCSFFTACYHAVDFDRAEAWAGPLREQGLIGFTAGAPIFLASHCESVRATLLCELGRWGEAEAVLERAMADFEAAMARPSWHPAIALADLRVRQGRLADAEALLLGRDQAIQALLPTARLHLARGDHDLARAAARRGLRVLGSDRLRAAELLSVLVSAELGKGDLHAARLACEDLCERTATLTIPALQSRAVAARARVAAALAEGRDEAVEDLEALADRLDASRSPWVRATVLLELARLREEAGDLAGAVIDAKAAAAALATLDVVLPPQDRALLERLDHRAPGGTHAVTASLAPDGRWFVAAVAGTAVRLPRTKGLCYLVELLANPGVERHALDLVDRVEGVEPTGGVDRRSLGDAGALLDGRARNAFRHRLEALSSEVEEALDLGRLDEAEVLQAERDQIIGQLAQAFGLGGRERRAASAAERARLNVTRALRAAVVKLVDALPEAGPALDRGVRTGMYCAYEPSDDDVRWIVQPRVNGTGAA